MNNSGLIASIPLRPCVFTAEGEWTRALFHRWADFAFTHGEEVHIGGAPGGQSWTVYAIVETEDGQCHIVRPNCLKFLDTDFDAYSWGDAE